MSIQALTVETVVKASLEQVWLCWTLPEHITQWCQASDEWHAPFATNDVRVGGAFKTTMAAKDGSFSFDFEGVYDEVEPMHVLAYHMSDGRKVHIQMKEEAEGVRVTERFDPESMNPPEMQQAGWQAILESFRRYTEQINK
ncbi:MAG TPA: SRPBCC domain-containing protein [Chitinophagaceae bacterium]|nr:SRPBCC domain-containing protein [Chitinophagaceae bacterium]